jgi:CRISPR/Cas system-associated exonuclease Cas4 (RecB family)
MKKPAWSYSSLSQFVNCPRQYQLLKVTKEIVQRETEEMKWGTQVHKHLEDRVKDNKPLPESLSHLEPLVRKITNQDGEISTEKQMAIDAEFKPVTWFDKGAWCRGIVDIGIRNGRRVWVGDYKTGKRRPDSDQLMLFAALLMHHEPEVDTVHTSFIWLKDRALDTEKYTREQLPEIWKHFMPKITRLEAAFEKDKWPAKPSGLCGWCPATKAHCEFSKKERRDD